VAAGYVAPLRNPRARRTYGYVLLNAMMHSGIYTWLGVYLQHRFGLGELGIGLALVGYGITDFLLGPVIGRLADRYGRARIIPAGMALGAACALALAALLPLAAAQAAFVALSLGYDMTQPPLGGIVTDPASGATRRRTRWGEPLGQSESGRMLDSGRHPPLCWSSRDEQQPGYVQ
jgi:predicted MFS family arabinose efflux permease